MISLNDLSDKQLASAVDWLEHPFVEDVFLPRVLKNRDDMTATLIATDESDKTCNILRGKLRLINQFLGLHDQALAAQYDQKTQKETNDLDKDRE